MPLEPYQWGTPHQYADIINYDSGGQTFLWRRCEPGQWPPRELLSYHRARSGQHQSPRQRHGSG